MTNKIGAQFQSGTPQDIDLLLVNKPVSLLLLGLALNVGLASHIREKSPDTLIALRDADMGDWTLTTDWTNEFITRALDAFAPFKQAGLADIVLSPNEPVIRNDAEARTLNGLQVTVSDAFHANGYKVCGFNFSVGNPDLSLWQYLTPALARCDYLGLHEYAAPTLADGGGNLTLRYRKIPVAHPPILITECGIDGGTIGRGGGYRDFTTAADYIAQLKGYATELAKDDSVKAAHLFLYGRSDDHWKSWDIADDENDRAQFIAFEGWAPPVTPPPVSKTLTDVQLAQLVTAHGFVQPAIAVAVALAESGGTIDAINTSNVNGSVDRGLWQINSIHSQYDAQRLLADADYNAQAAWDISGGGWNWNPWTTFKPPSGSPRYLDFMKRAQAALKAIGPHMITASEISGSVPFLTKRALVLGLGAHLYGEVYKTAADGNTYILDVWEKAGIGTQDGHFTDGDEFFFDPKNGFAIGTKPPVITPPPAPGVKRLTTADMPYGQQVISYQPKPGEPFWGLIDVGNYKFGVGTQFTVFTRNATGTVPAVPVTQAWDEAYQRSATVTSDGNGTRNIIMGAGDDYTPGDKLPPDHIYVSKNDGMDREKWPTAIGDVLVTGQIGGHTEATLTFQLMTG